MATAYYRSGGTIGPNSDCSYALKFYEKAMSVASDKELVAKACFMAAKCEQNMYYISDEPKEEDYWIGIYPNYELYRTNFKKLRDEFNKTGYYNEVINECKYFAYFVN